MATLQQRTRLTVAVSKTEDASFVGNQPQDQRVVEPEDVDDSEADVSASSSSSPQPSPPRGNHDTKVEWSGQGGDDNTMEASYKALEPETESDRSGPDDTSDQLRVDIEVLAVHLQQQTNELERSQVMNAQLRLQMEEMKAAFERELESVEIENEALRRQNALLTTQRDEQSERAQVATETHTELTAALRAQQQRDDHARTVVAGLVKERDGVKKQLDDTRSYCRRLEEDVVGLRTELQHLRTENKALLSSMKASTTQQSDRELKVIKDQQQQIDSLRADLLQMEFEYKTLSVDKDKLSRTVSTLQRQSECRTTSYDVISLHGDDKKKQKKRLSIITGTGKQKAADKQEDGFTNMMTLPNSVDEAQALPPSSAPRARTPMGSLVFKTFFSAKKKLFSPSSHPSTVVIPE